MKFFVFIFGGTGAVLTASRPAPGFQEQSFLSKAEIATARSRI